jgi:hypothetical protein
MKDSSSDRKNGEEFNGSGFVQKFLSSKEFDAKYDLENQKFSTDFSYMKSRNPEMKEAPMDATRRVLSNDVNFIEKFPSSKELLTSQVTMGFRPHADKPPGKNFFLQVNNGTHSKRNFFSP